MKKIIIAILAILYIGTSTGAGIHLHYCMGKLSEWNLGHEESKICKVCGMENAGQEDNGCCKDEHQFVKNDSDQKYSESLLFLLQKTGTAIVNLRAEIPPVHIATVVSESPLSDAPPRCCSVPVYILNRSFLI